ncbi:putative nuclease HARBI1 [Bombina bombina]|uniref:putative nuclease HARBI1 n=1 Tax=Bombina bombina TaxID=8345 RepID=UPI00235A5BF3|nr:putative nuclease HARBI1 [Bombina bombina]
MEIVIAMFHTIYMRRMERRIDGQAVQQIDRLQRRRRRIPRFFRPRSGLDALSDIDIIRRFRLSRESIERLYNQISGQLEPITFRTHALPGMLKLLAVLHFLATGSFQSATSVVVGMSQPSFSRHLTTVIDALLSVFKRYVFLPNTAEEWHSVKLNFFRLAGIPNVLGAIDCTHVRVRPPHLKEEMYRNRKFYHSLNIQMVCDAGDAGYSCRNWLLTPVNIPRTRSEMRYNDAHKTTRCVIERTFGMLKSRFRCLDESGGTLQYVPEKVAVVVLVCCMLHNIALRQSNIEELEIITPDEDGVESVPQDVVEGGTHARNQLIQTHFVNSKIFLSSSMKIYNSKMKNVLHKIIHNLDDESDV